jgi:hypothetical protein
LGSLEYLGNLRVLLEKFCFSGKKNTVATHYKTFDAKSGIFLCRKLKNRPEFG